MRKLRFRKMRQLSFNPVNVRIRVELDVSVPVTPLPVGGGKANDAGCLQ